MFSPSLLVLLRCAGLDGLAQRCGDYYKQGARFAKWRSVVSIPAGPSTIAVRDCAYGLARYAAIAQSQGLVSRSLVRVMRVGLRWCMLIAWRAVAQLRALLSPVF